MATIAFFMAVVYIEYVKCHWGPNSIFFRKLSLPSRSSFLYRVNTAPLLTRLQYVFAYYSIRLFLNQCFFVVFSAKW